MVISKARVLECRVRVEGLGLGIYVFGAWESMVSGCFGLGSRGVSVWDLQREGKPFPGYKVEKSGLGIF